MFPYIVLLHKRHHSMYSVYFIGLFVYFFFFPQISLITIFFQEPPTKTAKCQVLETSSDWGNDILGD